MLVWLDDLKVRVLNCTQWKHQLKTFMSARALFHKGKKLLLYSRSTPSHPRAGCLSAAFIWTKTTWPLFKHCVPIRSVPVIVSLHPQMGQDGGGHQRGGEEREAGGRRSAQQALSADLLRRFRRGQASHEQVFCKYYTSETWVRAFCDRHSSWLYFWTENKLRVMVLSIHYCRSSRVVAVQQPSA